MSLSSPHIQQFQEQGYVALPEFFGPRETEAIRAEVERLRQEGLLRNVATDGDGKTHSNTRRNLQLCPMYRHSPLFRALPFDPKVVGAVRALIGDPVLLHLDQVFLKPGGDGMGTNWHQDNAYFKIRDALKGTAMWIAAHDATVENGTLHVIPGSFREAYEHSRDPYSDHHIRCYPPEEKAVPVELPAGGVVFFCYGTAHSTGPNRTDRDRAGVAFHFLNGDYAHDDLVAPDRDYRPYLTGPDATGGKREYGVAVSGAWGAEVERALRRCRARSGSDQYGRKENLLGDDDR
jgi:phytanoyl-CoA hydroxylase